MIIPDARITRPKNAVRQKNTFFICLICSEFALLFLSEFSITLPMKQLVKFQKAAQPTYCEAELPLSRQVRQSLKIMPQPT